jgi:amino acid adenylation domain-containing protein
MSNDQTVQMNIPASTLFSEADLETSIPDQFRKVVRGVPPDQIACRDGDETLSYAQLDQLSDRLAAAIIAHLGLGQSGHQQPVATLFPHTCSMLVGVLGVLKSGHFYVPTEPGQGMPLIRQILDDCATGLLITTAELADWAEQVCPTDTEILTIEEVQTAAPEYIHAPVFLPQMVACLIYTSGSTGQPQGVIRPHAQQLLLAYLESFDRAMLPHERIALVVSYTFGFSTQALYGALLTGAELRMLPLTETTPSALNAWLESQQINRLICPPGTIRDLNSLTDNQPPLINLHRIVTGMEPVGRRDIDRLAQHLPPQFHLQCQLGSTEGSIYARFIVDQDKLSQYERVPAGYAPPHNEVFVVDDDGNPLPPNQPGQICVRSRYVSQGYWNLPKKTAARFRPDPEGGDRPICLTGDLGRLSADGLLEFLGRMDDMLKIRGYRVEPATIEQAMLKYPAIAECCVVGHPQQNGELRLIAYLGVPGNPPTIQALREHALQSLPTYMVPSRFIVLDRLPRNARGKIDRTALPTPTSTRPDLSTPFLAPTSDLECRIAEIWAELLEIDDIGLADNFFDLGGESLTALRMLMRVEQQIGIRVPPDFFHDPTIAHLAQLLSVDNTTVEFASLTPQIAAPPIPNHRSPRTLHKQFRDYLVATGPIFQDRVLPYALGIRLQRAWLRQPLIQQRLFAKQIVLLQRWMDQIGGVPNEQETIMRSLIANTWQEWRNRALQPPRDWGRWVEVHGIHHLHEAFKQRRGVVLGVTHSMGNPLVRMALQRYFPDQFEHRYMFVGGSPKLRKSKQSLSERLTMRYPYLLEALHQASILLQQKRGWAMIALDGFVGRHPSIIDLYGRRYPLYQGAAALAAETGSLLTLISTTFTLDGRITITFDQPLDPTAGPQPSVEDVSRWVITRFVERWPDEMVSLKWNHLKKTLELSHRVAQSSGAQ